jgi:hypothetical protein
MDRYINNRVEDDMQSYSEQDTERARQQERAASMPVPAPGYGAPAAPMFTPRDRNNRLAKISAGSSAAWRSSPPA